MTARWRTILRMRALLRLLLDSHVPLGALIRCIEQVKRITDEHLPNEQRLQAFTPTGQLALGLVHDLLGDDVELIDRDGQPDLRPPRDVLQSARDLLQLWLRQLHRHAPMNATDDSNRIAPVILTLDLLLRGDDLPPPRPPGEPLDLQRVADELRRRINVARLAFEHSIDGGAEQVHDALGEVLEFVLPLRGAPLPEVERFDEFLDSREFYDAMQAYRHAPVDAQATTAGQYDVIKAVLRQAVRR